MPYIYEGEDLEEIFDALIQEELEEEQSMEQAIINAENSL